MTRIRMLSRRCETCTLFRELPATWLGPDDRNFLFWTRFRVNKCLIHLKEFVNRLHHLVAAWLRVD